MKVFHVAKRVTYLWAVARSFNGNNGSPACVGPPQSRQESRLQIQDSTVRVKMQHETLSMRAYNTASYYNSRFKQDGVPLG